MAFMRLVSEAMRKDMGVRGKRPRTGEWDEDNEGDVLHKCGEEWLVGRPAMFVDVDEAKRFGISSKWTWKVTEVLIPFWDMNNEQGKEGAVKLVCQRFDREPEKDESHEKATTWYNLN